MQQRWLAALGSVAGVSLFALAIALLQRELAQVHYRDVALHLHAIPSRRLALAVVLTGLGYFTLTGYDALALRCAP